MADRAPRPPRYHSHPSTIEAVPWNGDNLEELQRIFGEDKVASLDPFDTLEILAGPGGVSGWLEVPRGHYVARNKGDNSDLWPLAPKALKAKYERAKDITVFVNNPPCPRCGHGSYFGPPPATGGPLGPAIAEELRRRRLRS